MTVVIAAHVNNNNTEIWKMSTQTQILGPKLVNESSNNCFYS